MSQWKLTNFEDLRPGDEFWWTADANGMQEGGTYKVLSHVGVLVITDGVSFVNNGYFWVRASPKPVRFDCHCPHCGGEIKMNVQGGE
jgi:hypothetical protein